MSSVSFALARLEAKRIAGLYARVAQVLSDEELALLFDASRRNPLNESIRLAVATGGSESSRMALVLPYLFPDIKTESERWTYIAVLAAIGFDKTKGKPSKEELEAVMKRLRAAGVQVSAPFAASASDAILGADDTREVSEALATAWAFAKKAFPYVRKYGFPILGAYIGGPIGAAIGGAAGYTLEEDDEPAALPP